MDINDEFHGEDKKSPRDSGFISNKRDHTDHLTVEENIHSGILILLLLIITLTALALRLYKIGEWSFWGDEMITVMRALGRSGMEPLPRLSVSLTAAAFDMWGVSEWSARIPAAIIGALTIPVVYFGARRMFDPSAGMLAALFLAVSIWHIYWSQNARFYSTLLFFYTLALFFFHFGLEKDRPGYFRNARGAGGDAERQARRLRRAGQSAGRRGRNGRYCPGRPRYRHRRLV